MIVTPLATPPAGAVRNALLSHGWEGALSVEAAAGLEACAFHLTALPSGVVEQLLAVATKYGLDLLTGDDWALVVGTRNRMSAMARSWHLPGALRPLAEELGRGLPADRPQFWRLGGRTVALEAEPVLLGGPDGSPTSVADDEVVVVAAAPGPEAEWPAERGIVVSADDADLRTLTEALEAAVAAGVDVERIAIEAEWRAAGGEDGLRRLRALGRPVVCRTDEPAIAALAWRAGAQLFRSTQPAAILGAIAATWGPAS